MRRLGYLALMFLSAHAYAYEKGGKLEGTVPVPMPPPPESVFGFSGTDLALIAIVATAIVAIVYVVKKK